MEEHTRARSSAGNAPVACDAFDANGALRRTFLDRPVAGPEPTVERAGTSERLGTLFGTGETLLVFLRHLG